MNKYNIILSALFLLWSVNNLVAQQLVSKTLIHDGETREYTVYIPANYQENTPTPLMFNFHGGDGDIASQIAISDMRPIADTARFIVIYPQAIGDPNDGGARIWTHKEPTTVDDIFFVEAMIDAISTEYNIDEKRVYACGYSNGGEFSFELACRLSHRIAAIGVVARSMFIDTYNECAPSHPTAVVTIHGTDDDYDGITFFGTTYYISLDDANSYWSSYNNTNTNPTVMQLPNLSSTDGSIVEHYSWNDGDACVAVEHYKVIGGGHDWPGSFGNMDMDASLAIWNFVSKYDRTGQIGCNATSIEEEIEQKVVVYPNPTTTAISIEMGLKEDQPYYIYTTSGELLLSGKIKSTKKTIDISALPANVYLLKVGNKTKKLLKLRN